MECGKQNIKIVEGNEFALVLPLKQRTFVASTPIDEDIVYADLQNVVLKIGDTQFTATLETYGVQVLVPYNALTRGTYDILLTATYHGSEIRASYFEALTIVQYNSQSDAQQYIAGSPIVLDAAYVIGGTLTDAELEALKEEYREKNAQLDQAIADAEEAKEEWEQKAADLDGVAQESTSQDILTAVGNIHIDTSDLAKQGTNPDATLSEVQAQATSAASDAAAAKTAAQNAETTAQATANKNEIIAQIQANAGIPTLTIPDSTASQELAPNTLYIFATRTSTLTLTLGTPIVGIANEYHFFVVCGSTAPTINFPAGITWNGGSAPTIAADKTYEVSILNNVAAYFEV